MVSHALAQRLFLFVLLALLMGCSDDQSSPTVRSRVRTDSVDVRIVLDSQGARLLEAVPSTGIRKAATGLRKLRYELRDSFGKVRAEGLVDDPRALRSEWIADGSYKQVQVSVSTGLASLRLPSIAGNIVLLGDGDREIGRVAYDPKLSGRSSHALLNRNQDILGSPVRLAGGDAAGKKLNILVLPEGFTDAEMDAFHAAVDNMVGAFKNVKAYQKHADRIQIWRQDIRSKESGVDKPLQSVARETAFDVTYGDNADAERCTWFGSDTALQVAEELGKVVSANVVVVVANDTGWGGCAGGGLVVQTLSSDAGAVLAHEIGHAVFGLADEYDYGTCNPGATAPNISSSANRNDLPWKDLVTTSNLPTAETADNGTVVGAFEGAAYCTSGMYRPQLHCMMGEVDQPFCTVCARELDKWFGGSDSPADSAGDTGEDGTGGTSGGSACGDVSYEGTCQGSQLAYCDNGTTKTVDCGASGYTCGWSAANSYNDCLPPEGTAGGASQGGGGGDEVGGSGSGETGGSPATGGASSTGGSSSSGCGSVTAEGECDGAELRYCDNSATLQTVDCAASGYECGWNAASNYYDCVQPSTGAGGSAGQGGEGGSSTGGTSGSDCGSITWEGECQGNTVVYCENGSLKSTDCSSSSGYECGWNASGYYDCIATQGGTGGSAGSGDDPCAGISYEGQCDGNTLQYCSDGTLVTVNCDDTQQTCSWDSSGYWNCL